MMILLNNCQLHNETKYIMAIEKTCSTRHIMMINVSYCSFNNILIFEHLRYLKDIYAVAQIKYD